MNGRKNVVATGLGVLLLASMVLLGATTAYSFVPSCEEELAHAYPSLFQADLAACDDAGTEIDAEAEAELSKFAARLQGSWQLSARTNEGLPVDPWSRNTRLFFDVNPQGAEDYFGLAMLIDQDIEDQAVAPAEAVAGLWRVVIEQAAPDRVSLRLEQGTPGATPASQQMAQMHSFYQTSGVFVSVLDESATSNRWDRMILMDNSLTYVSCDDGVVERFLKTSDRQPRIEESSLDDYWEMLNQESSPRTVPAARTDG